MNSKATEGQRQAQPQFTCIRTTIPTRPMLEYKDFKLITEDRKQSLRNIIYDVQFEHLVPPLVHVAGIENINTNRPFPQWKYYLILHG